VSLQSGSATLSRTPTEIFDGQAKVLVMHSLTLYNPESVERVLLAKEEIKQGKGVK